jgi:DNA-directed RNA polymerase specialized sigma24 family protein
MTSDNRLSQSLLNDLAVRLKTALRGTDGKARPHDLHLFWKKASEVAKASAARLCRNRPGFDAEDVVQTTLTELVRDFPQCLFHSDDFAAFLKGAVRHRFLDQCRRLRGDRRRRGADEALAELMAEVVDPVRLLMISQVKEIVEGLNPDDKIIVHELQELLTTSAAIAKTGRSRAAYYRHRTRLLQRLRRNSALLRLMKMLAR